LLIDSKIVVSDGGKPFQFARIKTQGPRQLRPNTGTSADETGRSVDRTEVMRAYSGRSAKIFVVNLFSWRTRRTFIANDLFQS